jgi:hypothetical protein
VNRTLEHRDPLAPVKAGSRASGVDGVFHHSPTSNKKGPLT